MNEKRLPVFYLHPREIDPGQMRLPMSAKRNFSTYGIKSTLNRKCIGSSMISSSRHSRSCCQPCQI
ncbi:MAG: DUF3473 domain-containing protein [Flavobacteriales bacterium]|nr:DUF3473 domain-containing protein [Flavobacteriales bacterium]